jgi:SAM-dependent methyltransferase
VSPSLIYRSATGYELAMRALYGRHHADRLRAVAEQVPDGSSVVELCCGPGTLYNRHLRGRVRSYTGLDVNDRFLDRLRRAGADARHLDLNRPDLELPEADVTIMQASLYHFLPDADWIVDRMLAAAHDRAVISEPIRNLATSNLPIVGLLGRHVADPGTGGHSRRFTEETLDRLMARHRERLVSEFRIPGGREKVYVLRGRSGIRSPLRRSRSERGKDAGAQA